MVNFLHKPEFHTSIIIAQSNPMITLLAHTRVIFNFHLKMFSSSSSIHIQSHTKLSTECETTSIICVQPYHHYYHQWENAFEILYVPHTVPHATDTHACMHTLNQTHHAHYHSHKHACTCTQNTYTNTHRSVNM